MELATGANAPISTSDTRAVDGCIHDDTELMEHALNSKVLTPLFSLHLSYMAVTRTLLLGAVIENCIQV
jgi:hypothetical protein